MKKIPYGRQNITEKDINSVIEVLKSDFLTQGPKIIEFEKVFSEYIGCKYSVAVSNGTAALHLSVLSLGLNKGDKVITSPITFAASANCVSFCGGEVVFSDIDPKTYLLDLDLLEKKLNNSPKNTFKGIIPVDFAGRSLDYERLRKIADQHNLWILEDSCHSPGGFFVDSNGIQQKCGNGSYADLAIFSFHPVKHIATGEGGMITTNNKDFYNKLKILRTHGITKDSKLFTNSVDEAYGNKSIEKNSFPGWYMEMQYLGYNYRMTDFQAALGISQLERAYEGIQKRRDIASFYFEKLKNNKNILNQSGVVLGHAYHLYVIEVEKRFELYNFLRDKNIFCQIHYFPCHKMPFYKNKNKNNNLNNSEKYYSKCISLPMFPNLTDSELIYIVEMINCFYDKK